MTYRRISPEDLIRARLEAIPARFVIEVGTQDTPIDQQQAVIDWWARTLSRMDKGVVVQRKHSTNLPT